MPISKPTLPPRKGYVEVEVGGVRQYAPIAAQTAPDPEPSEPTADELLAVLLGEVSK